MKRKSKTLNIRCKSGNILLLLVLLLATLSVFIITMSKFALAEIVHFRLANALESASLAAATDLSKIVVTDPQYGFVALRDYAPIGTHTLAADGEPVPVVGINTVLANARLQSIIAARLNDPELTRLAQQDIQAARRAAQNLNQALAVSLNNKVAHNATDIDGNSIDPIAHAKKIIASNLEGTFAGQPLVFKNLDLSLGWLDQGSSSQARAPLPYDQAEIPKSLRQSGQYLAFVDVPFESEHFYFAGLSRQPELVDTKRFKPADGKRVCSIVKLETVVSCVGQSTVSSAACAMPGAISDVTAPAIFSINFPNGFVPGISCMRDIMANFQLQNKLVNVYNARGGDFPQDMKAHLVIDQTAPNGRTVSSLFVQGLHDWLRTVHGQVQLDSILQSVNQPFRQAYNTASSAPIHLLYGLDPDGKICVRSTSQTPFLNRGVHENQMYALSLDAIIVGNCAWTMSFRDQVSSIGANGGKHAGQPMSADAVNWCDLQCFGADSMVPRQHGQGSQLLQITPHGQLISFGEEDGISSAGAIFTGADDKVLARQPRSTYYAGGMAVDFELSSPKLLTVDSSIGSAAL